MARRSLTLLPGSLLQLQFRALMKLIFVATGNALPGEAFKYNVSHFRFGILALDAFLSFPITIFPISALGLMNAGGPNSFFIRALENFPRTESCLSEKSLFERRICCWQHFCNCFKYGDLEDFCLSANTSKRLGRAIRFSF